MTTTFFDTLREGREAFRATQPVYCDYGREISAYSGRHGPAKLVEFDTADEGRHCKACPEYPHDCIREGCGIEWQDSWVHGATLYLRRGGHWVEVAEWENWEKGGLGF